MFSRRAGISCPHLMRCVKPTSKACRTAVVLMAKFRKGSGSVTANVSQRPLGASGDPPLQLAISRKILQEPQRRASSDETDCCTDDRPVSAAIKHHRASHAKIGPMKPI